MTPEKPLTVPRRPRCSRAWRRHLARLPRALFRVGLGRVFGRRVLLLHHEGRATGLDLSVALEVVAYDREGGSWTLASGFGPKADWYQNLRMTPTTVVQSGSRHFAVTAHFLTAEEGGEAMVRYAAARPRTARRLCPFMGFATDGSPDAYRRVGCEIPFVRLDAGPGQLLP
ncbi:nitroreductase family deazaflavin-dependent oxidoreductase [Streptomyces sp. S501]|nr:nitroreductase family deazaflavin-dependent oxidoreductase [Streptomyces sp. S501]QBR09786.1 nitroreductase family deazaflavin-dependent oxidoreductase [Streptomyces sp. S501]